LKKNLFYNLKYYTHFKKNFFLPVFNTIIFSILYKNPKLITDYLAIQIKKDKKHKKILNDFILVLEKIFFSNVVKFKGFKLRLNGKLNGSMRKSRYQYSLGKIELHKINNYLTFDISLSYTKFGVIAIKL
jgi:ribosomal protein S3